MLRTLPRLLAIDSTSLLVSAVFVSACFHPSYDHPACSPDGECPSGMACQAGVCVGQEGVPGSQSFDFTALEAGQLVNMTADAQRGSLTPNAYTYGGLAAYGLQGTSLWTQPSSASWSALAGVVPSGTALWRGEGLSHGSNLAYLGISDPTQLTMWFEGEVWLDASSTESFSVSASDFAFVDLALPGTTEYKRVADSTGSAPVATPVSGWYPVRVGLSGTTAGTTLGFLHSDRSLVQAIPWTRERLRTRASELRGALRTVFDQVMLGGGTLTSSTLSAQPPVVNIEAGGLMPDNEFPLPPQGTDTNDNWSARYVGQVYIANAGNYTLIVKSDDGNRARLATQWAEMNWTGNIHPGNTVLPAALSAGWNDVMVDYEQRTGGRELHVTLMAFDGSVIEIPHDQIRPVESNDDRLVHGSDDAPHTIAGDATTPGTAQIAVSGYAGEIVKTVGVAFYVTSANPNNLVASLVTPTGQQIALGVSVDTSHSTPPNAEIEIPLSSADLLGTPASGTWKVIVANTVAGNADSQLVSAKLVLHTSGGPDKIARTASWISSPIDAMTQVIGVDRITWDARTPAGTSAVAKVRACQQADCSDDPAWSDDDAPMTALPVAAPGRYLQIRIDLTSDGTIESELRSVAVQFRRASG